MKADKYEGLQRWLFSKRNIPYKFIRHKYRYLFETLMKIAELEFIVFIEWNKIALKEFSTTIQHLKICWSSLQKWTNKTKQTVNDLCQRNAVARRVLLLIKILNHYVIELSSCLRQNIPRLKASTVAKAIYIMIVASWLKLPFRSKTTNPPVWCLPMIDCSTAFVFEHIPPFNSVTPSKRNSDVRLPSAHSSSSTTCGSNAETI